MPVSVLHSTATRERRTSHILRSPVFRKQHSYQRQLRSAPTKQVAPTQAHVPQTTPLSASVLPALLPATSPQQKQRTPSPVHSQQPTLFPAIIPSGQPPSGIHPSLPQASRQIKTISHHITRPARACGACRHHNPPHFFTSLDIHPQTTTYGTFTSQKTKPPKPTPTPLSTTINQVAPSPAQAQCNAPLPASVLPAFFPQTALHNKGRLTPGLGGSHPGASKLTTTKHRRHRFRPHQRCPNKSHPHKHKSTPNTATSISYTGTAPTSSPTATSNDTQTIPPQNTLSTNNTSTNNTPTSLSQINPVHSAALLLPATPPKQATSPQAHFPQTTLLPASVTPALLPLLSASVIPAMTRSSPSKNSTRIYDSTDKTEVDCKRRWKTLQNLFSRRGHALQSSLTVHSTLLPVAPFTAFSVCVPLVVTGILLNCLVLSMGITHGLDW